MPLIIGPITTIRVRATSHLTHRPTTHGQTHPAANAVLTQDEYAHMYPDFTFITYQPATHEPPPEILPDQDYLVEGTWHGEQCFHFQKATPTS